MESPMVRVDSVDTRLVYVLYCKRRLEGIGVYRQDVIVEIVTFD